MNKEKESKREYGLRRVINKILQAIARSTLASIKMRAVLQSMRGVNFKNVSNTQIGDNVGFDGIGLPYETKADLRTSDGCEHRPQFFPEENWAV